jgi:hypothetical protein
MNEIALSESITRGLGETGTFETESVPNGTPGSSVAAFVKKFEAVSAELATIDGQLEDVKVKDIGVHIKLGKVVHQASQSLKRAQYKEFCDRVKLKGSERRKYRRIGADARRLEQHVDCLPPNRTTVYEIARTSPEDFDRLLSSGTLTQKMTKPQMDACLNRVKSRETIRSDLIIDFGEASAEGKRNAYDRLEKLRRELGFRMKPSTSFSRIISAR